MALAPGTSLGPYQIVAALGAGGMGEVYRARDTRLGRDVAIKVLSSHLTEHPEVRARFEREAKAISSLNHPNICTLHDVGHQDGVDFLVMELVEGEALDARIAQGPLPPDQVLRVGMEIADALDRAHRQGLVHRDLKPSNVMLTRSGAKLLDFGLARTTGLGQPTDLSRSPTMTRPLTTEGTIVGTFQYMAPEQLEGGEADARSDLWALGVVLYEMATGRKAFQGKSQASLISSIMKDEPRPIAELQPLSPPGLDRLVRACLAKDPDERLQTAHDLKLQLRWVAEGGSQAGVPAPVAARRRDRERLAWLFAVAFGVALVAVTALSFFRRGHPEARQAIRFEVPVPPATRSMQWPRISPDGRTLAFLASDSTGKTSIWVKPMNSLAANPLPGTENAGRPFWSPDSRYLAYFSGDQLKKIAVAGGPPQLICEARAGFDGTWGSRDVILFDGSSGDSIRQVSSAGGPPTAATSFGRSRGEIEHSWPCFLPDGRHFLYNATARSSGGPAGDALMVGTLGSKQTIEVGHVSSRVDYAPSGHVLYVSEGTLMARPFDPHRLRFTGEPFPVAERVTVMGAGRANFSVSSTGELVMMTGTGSASGRLVWVDRSGRELGQEGDPGEYRDLALAPDGTRLAYGLFDSRANNRDLWVRDLRRGVASRLTFDPGDENWPTWSPDGKRIAYGLSTTIGGRSTILAKPADGSGAADTLCRFEGAAGPEDWSRDGKTILLTDFEHGPDVWMLSAGEREARPLIAEPSAQRDARLSPDGRWLAYGSGESGRTEVFVRPFPGPGGKWQISTRGGFQPCWRGDGRELFYRDEDDAVWAVGIDPGPPFSAGAPTRLFQRAMTGGGFSRNRMVVTADGQRFLINAANETRQRQGFTVVLDWTAELLKP
jgi:Tol biopolymer transport system component